MKGRNSEREIDDNPAGHLVEVEDEVELAHVGEVVVQDLDEEVDGLQVGQLVVGHVHAEREEEARVAAVDHLVLPELARV